MVKSKICVAMEKIGTSIRARSVFASGCCRSLGLRMCKDAIDEADVFLTAYNPEDEQSGRMFLLA